MGNLSGRPFRGSDLRLGGVGKIEPEVSVIGTCLDEMEEFKGKDTAFVSDWFTEKVFKSCVVFLKHE